MADSWITDITHFLDEDGEINAEPSQAKVLAEYFAAIIMMASFPEPEYPPDADQTESPAKQKLLDGLNLNPMTFTGYARDARTVAE